MKTLFITFFVLLLIALSHLAIAQIPKSIAYQGVLTNATGNPVSDSTYATTFRFYNPESTVIWQETKPIQTRRGLFSVVLGSTTPIPDSLKFDRPYRLGIQIAGEGQLVPLISLNSVGYSLRSVRSDTAKFAEVSFVPINSIDSTRLADQAVTSEKLRDFSVQSRHLSRDIKVPNADSVAGITASFAQVPNTLYPLNSYGGITLVSNPAAYRSLSSKFLEQAQVPNAFISLFSGAAGCLINLIPGIGPTTRCLIEKGIEVTTAQLVTGALIKGNTTGVEAASDHGTALYAHTVNGLAGRFDGNVEVIGGNLSVSNQITSTTIVAGGDIKGLTMYEGGFSLSSKYVQLLGNVTQANLQALAGGGVTSLHSHSLGGDAIGALNSLTVQRLQGRPVSFTAPSTNQVLKWDGSQWAPGTDLTGGGSGVTNISQGNGILLSPNPITSTGSVSVNFGGNGSANTVAHSDHNHDAFYTPISGSGNYIQNRSGSAQSGSFWISGTGMAASLQAGNLSASYNAAIAGVGTTGQGIYGTSSSGQAGKFEITNSSNNNNALNALSNANYPTLYSNNTGGNVAVYATNNTINNVALFAYNPSATAIKVETNTNSYFAASVYNDAGNSAPGLYVQGYTMATGTKSAVLETSVGKELVFSIEAPDVEFYANGTGTLVSGSAKINFERLFSETISSESPIRITVTSVGSWSGIYVSDDVTTKGFTAISENGNLNAKFNWIAIARRKDFEKRPVLSREMIESMGKHLPPKE